MRTVNQVMAVDLVWEGPLNVEHVIAECSRADDYGIYQIYGTHNVMGLDTLLYIGKAQDGRFASRVASHQQEWISWEATPTIVYLGRIGGIEPIEEERHHEWGEMIDRVETLLIYFCAPPYNSSRVRSLRQFPPTIVLNFRRRHRLPHIVSNLYELSDVTDPRFRTYSDESIEPPR